MQVWSGMHCTLQDPLLLRHRQTEGQKHRHIGFEVHFSLVSTNPRNFTQSQNRLLKGFRLCPTGECHTGRGVYIDPDAMITACCHPSCVAQYFVLVKPSAKCSIRRLHVTFDGRISFHLILTCKFRQLRLHTGCHSLQGMRSQGSS